MIQSVCKINSGYSSLLKLIWIFHFWNSITIDRLQLWNSILTFTWRPGHSLNKQKATNSLFPFLPLMETFKTDCLMVICYCHLSLSVPKMMGQSLNPLFSKTRWELNWHSSKNSPFFYHSTIPGTIISCPILIVLEQCISSKVTSALNSKRRWYWYQKLINWKMWLDSRSSAWLISSPPAATSLTQDHHRLCLHSSSGL